MSHTRAELQLRTYESWYYLIEVIKFSMAWSPEDSLVIGISSRALFNLDQEDFIYQKQGTQAFIDYQHQHEEEPVEKGVAFPLIEALLRLNNTLGANEKPAIEVVIVSKNHPACAIRIDKSLRKYGLPIRRAVFTGGEEPLPYLQSFRVGLFLSCESKAVRSALAAGLSAGLIHGGPDHSRESNGPPIIAFDGDSVLFSDQADRAYKQGKLPGFRIHETENAKIPLPPGPLYRFVLALESLRDKHLIDAPPFRIALVTARDIEFCERPIRTLRGWGIQLDHAAFCADMSKAVVLEALKPLIFFDDSLKNCDDARSHSPTVMIPANESGTASALHSVDPPNSERPERFRSVCKLYLRKDFDGHSETLMVWHDENLTGLPDEVFEGFVGEVHRSAQGTPGGRQRRAAGAKNEDIAKFLMFLENALKKHSTSHRG